MLAFLLVLLVRVLFGFPSFAVADEPLLESSPSPCVQTSTEIPEIGDAPSSTSTESTTSSLPNEPSPDTSTTSSTIDVPVASSSTSSATETPPLSENAAASTSAVTPETPEATVETPVVRLERVFPSPTTGKEIVTLFVDTTTTLTTLLQWKIADETGPIFTITTSTLEAITIHEREILIALPSAKLNNSGDLVALYNASGQLVDFTRYPTAAKDSTWERRMDGSWSFKENRSDTSEEPVTSAITPDTTASSPTSTPLVTSPSTNITTSTPATTQATTILTAKRVTAETYSPKSFPPPPQTITTSTGLATNKPTKSVSAKKTTKTTVAKTSASPIVTLDSFPDPNTMSQPVRVRLFGFVATSPTLFQKQQFILLNNEGKGLLVKVPNTKQSPPRGTWVSVTGNLELNDSGYALAMKSNDTWTREKDGSLNAPKILDDLSLDERLDWTLAVAEGEITAIKSSGITILTATDEVFVAIPSHLQMRAGRFNKGDRLRVQGLLDPRKENLTILVQQADAILSLPKPAAIAPTPTTPSEQPWETVLAAGGAVALTHGAQHAHKQYKKRLLAKNLELAEAALLRDPGALANQERIR